MSYELGEAVRVRGLPEEGEITGRTTRSSGDIRYAVTLSTGNEFDGLTASQVKPIETDGAGDELISVKLTHDEWVTVSSAFWLASRHVDGANAEAFKNVSKKVNDMGVIQGLE